MDSKSRITEDFLQQIKEVISKATENPQHGENTSVLPAVPSKRGRKTSTKLVFEVHFSFKPPEFCLKENIDLEEVLSNQSKEGATSGNHDPGFSVKERLQDWRLEKRERYASTSTSTNEEKKVQDSYYHHLHTHLKFRSQPELIHFLLHGGLPRKPPSKKAKRGSKKRKGGSKKTKLAE